MAAGTNAKDDALQLFELAYERLCRIARGNRFVGRSADATQAQALVNETYIRLQRRVRASKQSPNSADLLPSVCWLMRTVARDLWRRKTAARRGGTARPVALDEKSVTDPRTRSGLQQSELFALHEAMEDLRSSHPAWFAVIACRYFEGRTVRETAWRMRIDASIVRAHRRLALIWLRRRLTRN